jgi:hypothetical protein
MKQNLIFTLLFSLVLSFYSCDKEDKPQTITFETDFNKLQSNKLTLIASEAIPETDGWSAVFAEYPERDEAIYELSSGLKNLPEPLDQSSKGYMLSGHNRSDALQMFVKKQLTGLNPNTRYTIETEVELASKYPNGSVGIGGSPGNAVHLVSKFAMNGYTLVNDKESNIQLKANKEEGNPDSVCELELGDVSTTSDEYVYKLVDRKKSSDSSVITSDKDGKLWTVVGTWSGFEGLTTLYYTRIKIILTEMK